jgi:hypothetical protein
MAKNKKQLPSPEGKAPKYYFVKYQQNGKTFYKDQSGKRVSADKVKQSKRKVYQLYYTGPEKNKLIENTRKKSDTFQTEAPQVDQNEAANVYLTKHAAQAIEANSAIYVKHQGKTYELVTNEARNKLVLFFYQLGENFYRIFKKLIDDSGSGFAQFFVPEAKGIKENLSFWDLDNISINDQDDILEEFPEAEKALKKFEKEKNELFKKYFKK